MNRHPETRDYARHGFSRYSFPGRDRNIFYQKVVMGSAKIPNFRNLCGGIIFKRYDHIGFTNPQKRQGLKFVSISFFTDNENI